MRIQFRSAGRDAFAERRASFLQVIAVVGLVVACWVVWSRSRISDSKPGEVPSDLPVLSTPSVPDPLDEQARLPVEFERGTTREETGSLNFPSNRVTMTPTNIANAPLVPPPTNTVGAVELPAWISEPPPEEPYQSHAARSVLEVQVGMANRGISPGPIDGLMGTQTRLAIRAFQQQLGIAATGELDAYTRRALWVRRNPMTIYVITTNDIARLMAIPPTWLGKSQLERLDYETVLEIVAERGWAYESFIRSSNPDIDWENIAAGTRVKLPNVKLPQFVSKAAHAKIYLSKRNLQAYDSTGRIMVSFPCSIAQRVDKRPLGELKVAVIVPSPNYTFNPEIFTESEEGRELGRKLTIPPGPNNPVGVAWIGLDRPGYGVHGTPEPELVGRTESHGCFRLANWNAQVLASISWVGMPVFVEE